MLPKQGVWVQSLIREIDPTCRKVQPKKKSNLRQIHLWKHLLSKAGAQLTAVTAYAKQGQLPREPRVGRVLSGSHAVPPGYENRTAMQGWELEPSVTFHPKKWNKSLPGRLSCSWRGSWIHSSTHSRQRQLEGCAQKLGISWEKPRGHPSSGLSSSQLPCSWCMLFSLVITFDIEPGFWSSSSLPEWNRVQFRNLSPLSVPLALGDIKYKTTVLTTDFGVLTSWRALCWVRSLCPCIYNSQQNKNDQLQYSCLEKSMDRGAWPRLQSMGLHDWACVHEGGGRWVGSNKLVELNKQTKRTRIYLESWYLDSCFFPEKVEIFIIITWKLFLSFW